MSVHEVHPAPLASGTHRPLGAFYTPSHAARFLARWTLRPGVRKVLEPCAGDGALLDALAVEARARGVAPTVWGVEPSAEAWSRILQRGAIAPALALHDDVLAVRPFPVDAVVAHPPAVRLRHLRTHERGRAAKVARTLLGESLGPDTGLWLPQLLHATRFLGEGGRLAFVVPLDATYERSCRSLWRHLGEQFASLTVVRVRQRMFPGLHHEVVLLLADGHGGHTDHVELQAMHRLVDLDEDRPAVRTRIPLAEVVGGGRPFVEALLPPEARELLRGAVEQRTVAARELVRFEPGYVCGDKAYFHPAASLVRRHRLPERSLVPTLTSSRHLRGTGLWTSDAPPTARSSLFLPPAEEHLLTKGEQTYVARGVLEGASTRHRCRNREPWYVTPDVRVAEVLVPVFSEAPALLVNDAGLAASNSLLCGYLRGVTAEHLATAWYTSLTLLELELQVHSLGGGVLVVVPAEVGELRLPKVAHATPGHLRRVSTLLAARQPLEAFHLGDQPVLQGQLGFDGGQVEVLRRAVAELAAWRAPYRPEPSPSLRS